MVDLILIGASFEKEETYNGEDIRILYILISMRPDINWKYVFITNDSRATYSVLYLNVINNNNYGRMMVSTKVNPDLGDQFLMDFYNFNKEYLYRLATTSDASTVGESGSGSSQLLLKPNLNSYNVQFTSNSLNDFYTSSQAVQLRHIKKQASNSSTLYTITWDASTNGGTCGVQTSTIRSGESLGFCPIASKTDCYFDGWFTASAGGSYIQETTVPTGSVTYYAHFRYKPNDSSGGGSGCGDTLYVMDIGTGTTTIGTYTFGENGALPKNSSSNTSLTVSGGIKTISDASEAGPCPIIYA